jgi:hypothetical protein
MKRALLALALVACADTTSSNPAYLSSTIAIAVDIRGSGRLTLHQKSATDVDVGVTLDDGYGLVAPNTTLGGAGRVEVFPEARAWQLYTARFSAPPNTGGPCGAAPVALALALTRRDGNARVAGALTAYCGSAYSGVPARVLRLTGETK